MKFLVLLGDGMADFPLPNLDGRTPLEAANTPAMDELARLGISGLFCPIPEGFPPGSDIGNLSLFGYNPSETFTGRAPLEAARQGILLAPDQVAFRCNLVTLDKGEMRSFTSGHISTEEASELIDALNNKLSDLPAHFHAGVSYRHLNVVQARGFSVDELCAIECAPPHNITDQAVAPHLPKGTAAAPILEMMQRSKEVLAGHPVNQARIAANKPPATSIWLWGQGRSPKLQPFKDRFALTGSVISAVDLVKGIGVCAGLEVIDVPGATGYLDTNYEGKVLAAQTALSGRDFCYLHVEAPDETSHEGRTDLKLKAIEDFDARVVAPCLAWAKRRGDVRILVAPDHITAISTKTHAQGPVPFALFGPKVEPNSAESYNEKAAAETGLLVPDGFRLTPAMLNMRTISQASLQGAAVV